MPAPSRVPAIALALLATALAPAIARADAIDDLAPGTWYAIPDTPMRAVCPPDTEAFDWSFYCQNVILAWGGGALDTSRGRMVLWGGGHGDYWGNEVYVFDLGTLAWSRIWGPTDDAQIPSGGTHEVYGDGNPGSRHTYSGLTYLPPPHDALIAMGGALWQSGSFGVGTWSFGFADNAWTRRVDGPPEMGYGDPSVFDPTTGHVFRRTNNRMVEYDPDADTFTDRAPSNGGFWAPNVSAALDPVERFMIIVGEGRLDTYDLVTDTYVQDVAIEGTGVMDLFGTGSPGVDFDTTQGRFVLWGGGQSVYTYDPAAASFSEHAGAGDDPGPISASGGAFGRFRYAPSRNAFVWIDSVDANVFVFRMTEGAGVPPTGGDTGGSSGADDTAGDTNGDGADGTAGPGEDGGATSAASSTATATDATATDTLTSGDTTSGEAAAQDDAGGCGCTARGSSAWWAGLVVALGLRPRRRDQSRRSHDARHDEKF